MSPIILSDPDSVSVEIVLDPSEVAENRTELHLNAGAIRVAQNPGIDWGDAAIDAYMAELARGNVPVDYRIPNRTITIPIILGTTGDMAFSTARDQLRSKVALFQREGGWLRRGTGRYADIVNATLKEPDRFGHLGYETEVELVLEAIPDFYGDEIELDDIVVTSAAEVVQVLQDASVDAVIEGDYPGRARIVVDEDDGETQLGLLWAWRSRHYSAAATAQIAYEAESLTPLDSAASGALTGASGGNAATHSSLRTDWTAVLSTEIAGVGHMTHTGTCRVWVRARSTSATPPQVRFAWQVGDLTAPSINAPFTIPDSSQFYLFDLGEVRLDPSPTGTHIWQGEIQAKAESAPGNVAIDKVYIVPVDDGYGSLQTPYVPQDLIARLVYDQFTGTTAGNALSGRSPTFGSGVWVTSGATTDFVFADALGGEQVKRITSADASPRFGVFGSTSYANVDVSVVVQHSDLLGTVQDSGVIARWTDSSNYLRGVIIGSDITSAIALVSVVGGVETTLATTGVDFVADANYTLRLNVFSTGLAVLQFTDSDGDTEQVMATSAGLAVGGTLATGKPGVYDFCTAGAVTRYYDDFAIAAPRGLDVVMNPNSSAEIRHDGCFREGATGWSVVVSGGDLPRIPPSGLESRPAELFLRLSRGDLEELPDSGIDDVSAQVFYRPSWLFPPA